MKKFINPPFLFLGALFAAWATLMASGLLAGFDQYGLMALRQGDALTPVGPGWLTAAMKGASHIGGTVVLLGLSLILVVAAWHQRGRMAALYYVLTIGGGMLLVSLLKTLFGRARPDLVPHMTHETSLSFPSGHATRSAIVYLSVALFLTSVRGLPMRPVYMAAGLLAVFIGVSRVFLGVHWPSDIIGGWFLAMAWVALWRPSLEAAVRKP